MRKNICIVFMLACTLFSCTHNNGDIGDLFGKWQLKETRKAGETLIHNDIFYNFQSAVVNVQRIYPEHTVTKAFGYFLHTPDSLQIRLKDTTPEEAFIYELPDTTVTFAVRTLTHKNMTLEKNGKEWIFRKY